MLNKKQQQIWVIIIAILEKKHTATDLKIMQACVFVSIKVQQI